MWRTFGASVVGASHRTTSTPCQDAFATWNLSRNEIVIAVADGAGSATQAERAARLAVNEAVGFCRAVFESPVEAKDWATVVSEAIVAARALLVSTSEGDGIDFREFATTLQVLIASQDGYSVARVGDGGGVLTSDSQIASLNGKPDNQYVNETDFLTSTPLQCKVANGRMRIDGVALFTDGLHPVAMRMQDWEPHAPFFRPIFSFAKSTFSESDGSTALLRLLAQPSFDNRTDDDRTLVVAAWSDD